MVKRLKKYAKFVVCCTLIMSLVAPSYASLSAADGPVFVTKAEFDSALADFNSRLTTFEAGINSKIDSQVTSYLDRNGIWNGAQQTSIKSTYYISAYEMFNISETDRIDYSGYTSMGIDAVWEYPTWENMKEAALGKSRPDGSFSGYIAYRPGVSTGAENGVWFPEFYISNSPGTTPSASFCFAQDLFVATKSGLAFVTVQQTTQQTSYIQYLLAPKFSGAQKWFADHSDSVDLGYAFVVNDVFRVRKSFWSLTASGSDFYSASAIKDQYLGGYSGSHAGGAKAYTIPISRYDATDNFFVQKGDRIGFAPSPIINNNSVHTNRICTWYPYRVVPTDTARSNWSPVYRWTFKFSNITIY